MAAYYNEIDKRAAEWLRELIKDGLIAQGDVDERSVIDVNYKDLKGYTQHHFFAGIGGWSHALRIAGWPDNKPVWTASLPCQPFSIAGKGLGKNDERHLLPHFLELVAQCKPDVIFGEQVERAIGHGWLDDLQTTMEAENYAVGHCILGAHSVCAAHIRQRLYWVADRSGARLEGREGAKCTDKFTTRANSLADGMGISNSPRPQQRIEATETARHGGSVESTGDSSRMGDTSIATGERNTGRFYKKEKGINRAWNSDGYLCFGYSNASEIDWIFCRDNKYRPVESGLKPLVDGVPRGMVHSSDSRNTQEARKMRLKGYGNAIVPALAAEFIMAYTKK